MMRKRILCFCHFPFAQYPDAKVPWDDVYLRWKAKPGRRVYRAAPCLVCKAEVLADLKMHEEIRNEKTIRVWSLTAEDGFGSKQSEEPLSEEVIAEHQTWYREDDARYRQVLEDLETQEFAMIGGEPGLTLYTSAKGINRREAERMLAWWLYGTQGFANPKFVWKKPKYIVEPMGFGDYSAEIIPAEPAGIVE